ncbi:MAG: 23S rRNA (uracil(1939)-C(5))-methyltransferase RlmD [Desulfamplus sp.]|nr:23S rRNA (uracil(1939)-C(5))-methyltransferase RlmD [Desulfamplus sp.]
MGFQKGKIVEVEIIDLAFGGMGVAKPEGFPIFVERAFPGDRVMVKITKKKKNYAEARVLEMVEPSKVRQKAPCYYADYCGGCRWQALPYSEQLKYKKQHVIDSLEHIGLLKGVLVKDVIPSEEIFGFRNKMEFSCSNSRWLTSEELENPEIKKDFGLGLHVPGTFDKIIDIENCLIQPDIGNQILNHIRQYIKESGLQAYNLKTHEGFWRFVMLRSSSAFGTWMVNLVTNQENDQLLNPLADQLMAKFPQIASVVNNVTARKASIATGEYEKVIAGDRCIKERLGEFIFEISANSFFQTNTKGAEALYSLVSKYAELSGKEYVIDLYSGTGTIPIWLSKDAGQVIGIEIVESAVKDARRNAKFNNITNCEFHVGDIKDVLPSIVSGYSCDDVMVIDPPRVGMHKDVVAKVIELAPKRIVCVSCNPATLSRDLALMKSKYRVVEVQPVDMFPHTFHIESVALLTMA